MVQVRDGRTTADDAAAARLARLELIGGVLAALLGLVWLALLTDPLRLGLVDGWTGLWFGESIYDAWAEAIASGRLDVPPRIAAQEGHYAPDGTAYIYHGALPLAPRLALAPFTDLDGLSLGRWITFGSAVIGAALLQHAALGLLRRRADPSVARLAWVGVTAAASWGASGATMTASNAAFYVEPVAMSFAAVCLALHRLAPVIDGAATARSAIVPLALASALCIHGRHTMAAGLLLLLGLIALRELWRTRGRRLGVMVVAALLVGGSGAGLMALNVARFGAPLTMHGSLDPSETDEVQHGMVFLGLWQARGENGQGRIDTFVQHGAFNLARIPANALVMVAGVPWNWWSIHRVQDRLHDALGEALGVGDGQIWGRPVGVGLMWAPWMLLGLVALLRAPGARSVDRYAALAAVAGGAVPAVLVLSYATIQQRYVIDLWQIVGAAGLVGLAVLPLADGRRLGAPWLAGLGVAAALFGVWVSAFGSLRHHDGVHESPPIYTVWSEETCRELMAPKGFDAARVDELCSLD